MFTSEQANWMLCPNAKIFIDFHGQAIAQHTPDRLFDINSFIQYLNGTKNLKWKEIYWRIWAHLNTLDCQTCD